MLYAQYALQEPDKLKIVAVAEPQEHRRKQALKAHGLDDAAGYTSVEALCAKGKLADAAIRNRIWVLVYIVGTFVVAPLVGIFLWG